MLRHVSEYLASWLGIPREELAYRRIRDMSNEDWLEEFSQADRQINHPTPEDPNPEHNNN